MFFLDNKTDIKLMDTKTENICLCILSTMFFLVTICLASLFSTNILLKNDTSVLSKKITIECSSPGSINSILTSKQKDLIQKTLSSITGVKHVNIIQKEEMQKIFEDFVPGIELPKTMSFPTIFEITVDNSFNKTSQGISEALSKISPHIRVYDHSKINESAVKLTTMFKTVTILLTIISMLIATVCIKYFFLNVKLINKNEISLLESLGASKDYIDNQMKIAFQNVYIKTAIFSTLCSMIAFCMMYSVFGVSDIINYTIVTISCIIATQILAFMSIIVTTKFSMVNIS